LRAIRAHRLVFIGVILATVLVSIAWLAVRTPEYEASSQLLIAPLPQDDQELLGFSFLRESGDPTRTSQTAASLIETRAAAQRTAEELGDGWTAQKVLNAVSVAPEGESNILAVTAKADSAELSARIANQFVRAALGQRTRQLERQIDSEVNRLEAVDEDAPQPTTEEGTVTPQERIDQLTALKERGDPTITLAQQAVPPPSATGAGTPLVIALALLAGLALGTGACVLLEMTGGRVRDEEEAVRLFPMPVLARVPELARRLRPDRRPGEPWLMPPSVREAFRTLFLQIERTETSRVIMLTSASTGDGKTTSAINLAASIAASGRRTILMDFDLRKPDVARSLGIDSELPLMTLAAPTSSIEDLIVDVEGMPNVSLVALGAVGVHDVGLVEALGGRLSDLIDEARQHSDYVVIDTAPLGEVSDALRFTSVVDEIIIVTRPGITNRANFRVMRDLLQGAAEHPRGFLIIGENTGATNSYYSHGVARARKGPFVGQTG
jgi:Mrp family chromosome partitioning ATPase/capsular polysaccharide biosynthesis protein